MDYLNTAINDIEKLIKITLEDIEDIKSAKHDSVFERAEAKRKLIHSFENKKTLLDEELVKLVKNNTGTELTDLLSSEEKQNLQKMKETLGILHEKNKEYAKFVVSVGEFYNSLIDSMFPNENGGYEKSSPKPASILKVRV